jgi:hypothetical protein
MNPLRAMQHNLGMELYGYVTHKVSHHLVNVAQMAVNDVLGRGHVWGLMLQPHGTESSDYYKQMYHVLLGGMISFLDNFSSCGRNHSLLSLSLGRYAGSISTLHVPSIDAADIKVPLSCGPRPSWE